MTLHLETIEEKRQRGIRFLSILDALRIQCGISKYRFTKDTGITWNTVWTWTKLPPLAYPSKKSLEKVERYYKRQLKKTLLKKKGSTSPNGSAERPR